MDLFRDAYEGVLERVVGATTLQDLQSAVRDLLPPYNLKHVVYHLISAPGFMGEHHVLVFTYPQTWIEHYLRSRYFQIDPVVLTGERSLLPIDWALLDRTPRPVRVLFAEAYDAGLGRQGLTFPIRGAQGDHAIFTITSESSDAEWQGLKPLYMRDFQVLANFVHERVLLTLGISQPDYGSRLSRRERECLQWAADGLTIAGTADKIFLSERAVRGYLDSARHKLNCLTKPQALAKAGAMGLVKLR